jgi:hypothetical protein
MLSSYFSCFKLVEILGQTQGDSGKELGLRPYPRELKKLNPSLRDGQLYYMENGKPQKPYARVLIRKIKR